MINYNKCKLMIECLLEYFAVYEVTLDTRDFVRSDDLEDIHKWISKNRKKHQRKINREDRAYQKSLR